MATRVNVILMRGLMGSRYSRGMDSLGAKLAKLKNVDYVTVEDYANWRSIRDRIPKLKDPTVIGGHSFGANAATVIASQLQDKVNFPLLLGFDPSQYWSWRLFQRGPDAITMNVKRVVNQFQYGIPIGGVKLWRESGSNFQIENEEVETGHTELDDLPLVHDLAIAAVKSL